MATGSHDRESERQLNLLEAGSLLDTGQGGLLVKEDASLISRSRMMLSELGQTKATMAPTVQESPESTPEEQAALVQQQQQTHAWPKRAAQLFSTAFKAYGQNVRKRPLLLLGPPLLLFAICVALGSYGVTAGAKQQSDSRRSIVTAASNDWAASFVLSFQQTFTPLVTISIIVRQDPYFPRFINIFDAVAEQLLSPLPFGSIEELQIAPMGNVSIIYPNPDRAPPPYIDIFGQARLRGGAISTLQARKLVISGPLVLVGNAQFGAVTRLPIFIRPANEADDFGIGKQYPTNCPTTPVNLCWDAATQSKFWGFATALVPLEALRNGTDIRLLPLQQKGYDYYMTRPFTSTEDNPRNLPGYVFANSSHLPEDPIIVQILIQNAVWTLYVAPGDGWAPSWTSGLLALVVLGSAVLAILVATIMGSWARQHNLLGEVMDTNTKLAATTKHLEEEHLRLDALLVRQYNLLSVLGGGGSGLGKKSHGDDHSSNSKGGLTLERIEYMRRQLSASTNTSTADIDSIQTIELLGEGAYGKVYKGLWRGSVVAVKTMVLPANMSGAEKREKMAVMEAAISSSLSHPNVVQTYTYAIKPIKDNTEQLPDPALVITSNGTDSPVLDGSRIPNEECTSMAQKPVNVHSYEVRLVLEFCDKGCLRDALDEGVFTEGMQEGPLNYCAVLDITADVAKAMLHLHSLNVLHGDLKARNIMLKSGGPGGNAMAKVADFGLSLKMDHLETHISHMYQGTMTHMAPEIMLQGHVSKGADVYAFGITMWEVFSARHPFKGVPRALLGHQITREGLRPCFPADTPVSFKGLAERCWHANVDMRPTFPEVLAQLLSMRIAEPGPTPAFDVAMAKTATSSVSSGNGVLPVATGVWGPATQGSMPCMTQADWTVPTKSFTRGRPTLPKIHEAGEHLSEADEHLPEPTELLPDSEHCINMQDASISRHQ